MLTFFDGPLQGLNIDLPIKVESIVVKSGDRLYCYENDLIETVSGQTKYRMVLTRDKDSFMEELVGI